MSEIHKPHSGNSMADDNAYTPVEVFSPVPERPTYWLRRFVILNAVLLGIPVFLIATAWVALGAIGTQVSGTSGSIGLATVALIASYFAVPNLVMLLGWSICRAPEPRS